MSKRRRTATGWAVAIVALSLVVAANLFSPTGAVATHEPANKVSASGSTIQVSGPNERVVLLSETVKTAKPTDLILEVNLECAIVTDVTTTGNDEAMAAGEVVIQVLIDGKAVPVSAGDTDEGRVVFCNRSYQRTTSLFDDDDATIQTFFRTREANSFSWMALDVGSATHTIEVVGRLRQQTAGDATAEVVVGNRTLIVEPTKSAGDEAVTALG